MPYVEAFQQSEAGRVTLEKDEKPSSCVGRMQKVAKLFKTHVSTSFDDEKKRSFVWRRGEIEQVPAFLAAMNGESSFSETHVQEAFDLIKETHSSGSKKSRGKPAKSRGKTKKELKAASTCRGCARLLGHPAGRASHERSCVHFLKKQEAGAFE